MKTSPLAHQNRTYCNSASRPYYGLLWEMGCGKTKTAIDTAFHLQQHNLIDAVLVIAPNGVHANWTGQEMPIHSWDVDNSPFTYYSDRAGTKKFIDAKAQALSGPFPWLVMTYDAVMTDKGFEEAQNLLKSKRCLMILDESPRIKNPKAVRTKLILKLSKLAPYRRILTGTPISVGPFDLYTQMLFLNENFWKDQGISTWTGFKNMFGVFVSLKNPSNGAMFQKVTGYQNLPLLQKILSHHTDRVTKEDVLDLPPKVYTSLSYEMTTKQREVYRDLSRTMFAEISETQIISVQFAMSLLLRLQQVVCGYVPAEHIETGEKELVEIDPGKPNPRLKLLYEITEDVPHQAIIWARFTRDIENIQKMLGDRCCLYYGKMGDTEREASLKQFREGTRQLLVANPACAGEGLTLTNAKTVIYYSSDYRFSVRRQSEDRAHRIGQADSVLYVDIVCSGTVDERIIKNLTAKNATACEITGDQLREWLTLPTLGA